MIVFLELLTFGIGLIVFLRFKAAEPASFRHGQAGLGQVPAFVNTLILLTGGWLMANALDRIRERRVFDARRAMGLATAFGVAFLIVKGWEYAKKLGQGLDLHHDSFHTMYWLLTGFHYLHVVVAVILLGAMAWGLRCGECTGEHATNIESSAVFWHLCDLIWLLLMPVIYLIP
jgi:nitric oxide reductase NorE protein